jgi:hypothetical protein
MNFTDILRLPCPGDSDYAALPVYMQRLAEEIEAKILAQRAAIALETNPPTLIQLGPNSAIGPFGTSSVLQFSLAANATIFSNYTLNPPGPFGTQPRLSPLSGTTFNSSGIWHLGFAVIAFAAVGAVTNDSNRLVRAQVGKQTPSGTVTVESFGRRINAEATIAAEYFTGQTTVLIDNEFTKYNIDMVLTHANAGSNMTVPVNGLLFWCTRLGSAENIEVI